MTVKVTKAGEVKVTTTTATVDAATAALVGEIARTNSAARDIKAAGDAAKEAVRETLGWTPFMPKTNIVDPQGTLIATISTESRTSTDLTAFMDALREGFPKAYKALVEKHPEAVAAATEAATKVSTYPVIRTK